MNCRMDKEHIRVRRLYSVPGSRRLRKDQSTSSQPLPHFLVRERNGGDVATFSLVQIKKGKNEGKESKGKMARNNPMSSRLRLRSSSGRVLSDGNCVGNASLESAAEDCPINRSRSGSGSMVFSPVKDKREHKFSNAGGYPINLPSTEPIQSILERLQSWSKDEEIKQDKRVRSRAVSFSNQSLLHSAISRDDIVELSDLIDCENLDLNAPDEVGITLLHRAAIDGSYRCLNFLLSQGADVDVTDFEGWTPLHDSVFHGHIRCAIILLISGADVEAETKDFIKPIEMAEDEEMILVVGRSMALNKTGQNPNYDKETLV